MGVPLPLENQRILVVEDDYLIAQMLIDILEGAGGDVIGPIGSLSAALEFVEGHPDAFDIAVLDVNLHGERSYPIADLLKRWDKPLVFGTGYGADALAQPYRNFPRCDKPYMADVMIKLLAQSVERGAPNFTSTN